MKNEKLLKLYFFITLFLVVLTGALYSYYSEGIIYYFFQGDIDYLTNLVTSGYFGIIVFISLVIFEVVFISVIPSIVLYTTGGLIFGPVYGSVIIWIGNLIGATIAYYLSKTFLKDFFEKKLNKNTLNTFNKYAEKYGIYAIFFLRLNPLTSSDVFNYVAGLTKMKYKHFILGTGLGLIPLIILTVYLGSSIIGENPVLTTMFIIGALVYILVIAGFFFYKKN